MQGIRGINPQPEHDTRDFAQEKAEVFSCHRRQNINQVHVFLSCEKVHEFFGQFWLVFHRQVAPLLEFQVQFHIKGCCNSFCNGFDPFLSQKVHLHGQGPNGPMKEGCLSDHIIGCSCMHGTKGHHSPFNRIDISTHDRLDLGNEVRGCYKSVIGLMWKGGMPSLSCKGDLDFTGPRKKGTRIGRNVPHLQIRAHMQTIKFIREPVAKSIVLIHEHSTSLIFFSWLEEKEKVIFGLHLNQLI